jgi:hypothetical protein
MGSQWDRRNLRARSAAGAADSSDRTPSAEFARGETIPNMRLGKSARVGRKRLGSTWAAPGGYNQLQ